MQVWFMFGVNPKCIVLQNLDENEKINDNGYLNDGWNEKKIFTQRQDQVN